MIDMTDVKATDSSNDSKFAEIADVAAQSDMISYWHKAEWCDVRVESVMRSKADIPRQSRSTIEMFRSCWLFHAIAKSAEATAGTARG